MSSDILRVAALRAQLPDSKYIGKVSVPFNRSED